MVQSLEAQLSNHLEFDEILVWTGKPKTGVIFRPVDIFLVPFSLIWCGFAIFWVIMASSAGIFALFGIPFVLIGLFFVFGRFIYDAKRRENTVYGLTKTRVIILTGKRTKKLKTIHLQTLTELEYSEKNDGSGTITFGPVNLANTWSNQMAWWPGVNASTQLETIENVREVYKRINELRNK